MAQEQKHAWHFVRRQLVSTAKIILTSIILILYSFQVISEGFKSIFAYKPLTQNPLRGACKIPCTIRRKAHKLKFTIRLFSSFWKYEIYFGNIFIATVWLFLLLLLFRTRDNLPATRDTGRLDYLDEKKTFLTGQKILDRKKII